jgi:hypothetical protein
MKVYKGRQKLSLEQAAGYYSFAYKIGVEHGVFTERERIINLINEYENKPDFTLNNLKALIKGEQE